MPMIVKNGYESIRKFAIFCFCVIALLGESINVSAHDNNSKDAKQKNVISQSRQQQLVYMVRQDCGSCHGMTLKGGLGPALLPQRLSQFTDQYLFTTIKYGRPEKAMPPWQPILSDTEIAWIVKWLRLTGKDQTE